LLKLINDLLDLSKIEADKMTLTMKSFSVNTLIKDIMYMQTLLLETKFDDINITADFIRLKQILFNLIGNAIKFTEQGKITVTATQDKDLIFSPRYWLWYESRRFAIYF